MGFAIYSATDLTENGIKPIPGGFPFAMRENGSPAPSNPRPILAHKIARYLGEPIIAILAETLEAAHDAADLAHIEYEPLAAVTLYEALDDGAPSVWDDVPGNRAFQWNCGDEQATDKALKSATHVTRASIDITRLIAAAMEPRVVLVMPQPSGELIVTASHQSPFNLRQGLVACGFSFEHVTVRLGDVGGSFGLKTGISPEDVVVAFAARATGRPVLWEATRSESFLGDDHARGMLTEGEIGFDSDGHISALRVRAKANIGAYCSGKASWATNNMSGVAGCYKIPAIHARVDGFLTHTSPSAAYRGAGRPEASLIIERLLDQAARELGVTPYALREKNLIPPEAMPYQTALEFEYDCGEFATNMRMAAKLADLDGLEERRAAAKARGRVLGLGIANCIELAGGPLRGLVPDIARLTLMADGRLSLVSGSMSVGQGHATTFTQLVADTFGIERDTIDYQATDTSTLPSGRGNGGSSGICVGGSAVYQANADMMVKLKSLAATMLEVDTDEVSFQDGMFRGRASNHVVGLKDIADEYCQGSSFIAVQAQFKPPAPTYPNGTHICEVEIDPTTGAVEVTRYSAVEDIGTVINPLLAEGQLHGGIVQGLGQILGEQIVYDDSGQLLTGSFMDYQMPRAQNFPAFRLAFNEVPATVNPLGAKGVGEAGTVGSLASGHNAICDALAQHGIHHFDMPATPLRIWKAFN